MALVASALVRAAKQRTFGSRGRQKISNAALLEEISSQDQLIVQMLSQIAPGLLATVTGTVATLTTSGNINGYTLAAGVHYRDFSHIDISEEKYIPMNVLMRIHQDGRPGSPAAMIRLGARNAVLYPIDPLGKRWAGDEEREWFTPGDHQLTYSYVPLPGVMTSLTDECVAPDMAREVIMASLELVILMAAKPMDEARVQAALQKRTEALISLRMQAYKFAAPQGHRGFSSTGGSDSAWIDGLVGS